MQQQAIVAQQFGNTALAYLSSAVHAQGADLQAMQDIVQRQAQLAPPQVLDLGCGAGHASFAVAPHAQSVVAYDLSEQMLAVVAKTARERGLHNISTQQGNVAQLPFADATFDIVMTRFSAHHWLDVPAALQQMQRVLRPGGSLIVVDIVAPQAALYDTTLQAVELLRDGSHVRNYRICEWSAKLAAAGFTHDLHSQWKLLMQFDDWVARMQTPALRVQAIRSLFDSAPEEAQQYFELQQDYSFSIDAAMFVATRSDSDIY